MTFEQLRIKHPRFIYKSYGIEHRGDEITITHEFLLEPDIVFRPRVTIPFSGSLDQDLFAPFAFNLGLIEAISYWKATCSAEFVVEAGTLSTEQIRFWQDIYLHGLGEFYFQNKIDFTQPNFLTISSKPLNLNETIAHPNSSNDYKYQRGNTLTYADQPDLVLASGGKDSAVTLALLKRSTIPFRTMVVNPTEASLANIRAAGLPDPIVVRRVMDPKLYELNTLGYLNGHTPFSAFLAFLGAAVAALYGGPRVIVSNERSADEGNVVYRGMEINHQYSKSFRFEEMFRAYCATYLTPEISYFSFLRPLNDVQIGMMFAHYPEFFTTFRSCNVGSRSNTWCGTCAKCAFTYLVLYPHMTHEQMIISFGADLFHVPEIIAFIRELVGLVPTKPFECVGTRDEAVLSLYLCIEKYKKEHREIPEGLLRIKSDLGLTEADIARLYESVVVHFSDRYNVPDEYMSVLQNAWGKMVNNG